MSWVRRILPARRPWHWAALAAVVVAAPAGAADPAPLPPELKRVPRDAALFVHVDFAALWNSKVGETFRSAKAKELDAVLAKLKEVGFTPDTVKTVTHFFPQLKGPGDQFVGVTTVTFTKPYDKAKLLAKMTEEKMKYAEKDGVVTFDGPGPAGDPASKATLVLTDPNRIELYIGPAVKYRDETAAPGPLDPAVAAAAAGATGVLGMNFASLPDEVRGDDVPPEVRPFQPLFRSDVAFATARLSGDAIHLEVRFRNKEKAKTLDAEKSLAAGVTLMQLGLGAGIQELEKAKDRKPPRPEAAFLPVVRATAEALKTAKVAVEETDAVATATVPVDLPFGPLVQEAFGGASNPRTAAARANTQNNLKQIALALHNYHDSYGTFPPAAVFGKKGKPMLSWRVSILPFVEQDALYKKFKLDEPWDSPHNKKVLDEHPMPPVFRVVGVTKDTDKVTHMQVLTGGGAMFDPVLGTKIQTITDGTSNTVMVVTAAKAVPWTAPEDVPFDPKADPKPLLLFQDDKGTSVAFADGSVRYISKTIDTTALRGIITRSGGEVVGEIP